MESQNILDNISKERRGFPRINVSIVIDYSIVGTQGIKTGQTKNISVGGACLIIDEDIKPTALLELKIYLPNSDSPIMAKGRVIWESEVTTLTKGRVVWESEVTALSDQRTSFEAGIEFLEIDASSLQKISQFVLFLTPRKK